MLQRFFVASKGLAKCAMLYLIAFPIFAGNTGIGVFVNQNLFELGGETPQISVSGFNSAGVTPVDVHVGVIAPNGVVYEFPDWNTQLNPWLSNFSMPPGFSYPAAQAFNLDDFPGGLSAGVWYAAAALTVPGTMNIIDLAMTPFNVVDPSLSGSKFGFMSFAHFQTAAGSDVDASGGFVEAGESLQNAVSSSQGQQPGLNQCVFNEIPLNPSTTVPSFQTLDAGSSIELSASSGGAVDLPRNEQAFNALGMIFYHGVDGQPDSAFYQGGAAYTFTGLGGSQISPFTTPTLVAPAPLNLTQPVLSATLAHNTASDLALEWDGNNGVGEVHVDLAGSTQSTAYSIDCRFADDGSAAVPANLLTQLKEALASGSAIPGLELPPGVSIPGLGTSVGMSVARFNFALFNTQDGELDHGIVNLEAGSFLSLTLE
jgi:hypothetical protein